MRILVLLALVAVGCGDGTNTQYLPIGSRCGADGDCGTRPYSCQKQYPGGYCQKDCSSNAECPQDSLCAVGKCRRVCATSTECRSREGYLCREAGATGTVCETASSVGDGGA